MDLGGAADDSGKVARGETAKPGYRLDEFFNITRDLLCIADREGRFLELNAAWERVLGYRLEDLRGRKATDFVHPDDRTATAERVARLSRGEPENQVNRFRHADGSYRWLEWHSSREGDLLYGTARDITERKAAEERLRESESRWRHLFDDLPDALLLLDDTSGTPAIADCNAALCAVTGYSRDELIGQPIMKLRPPEVTEEDVRRRARIVREAGHLTFEIEYRRKDGSQYPIEAAVTTIRIDGREMTLAVERDISVRKAAEEALREQDRILRDAQKVARVGSWHWVAATDMITWSEEYHHIVGHDPALPPPGYEEHLRWYTPESASRLRDAVQQTMVTGSPYELDLDLVRPDGSKLAVVARGEPVRDASGGVTGLRGTLQDITERKQIEAALEESERRLRLHIENTPVAVIEWDRGFYATSWNPAAERIFGYTAEEAVGQHASIILPEAARPLVNSVFANLVERMGGQHSTNQNVTKDGRLLVCEWFNTLLTSRDGRVVGVASVARDVTQRVAAEQALRESEERFREAIEAIPVAVVAYDGDRLVLANEAATTLSGFSNDEILSPGFLERAIGAGSVESILARGAARLRGELVESSYELPLTRKDGKVRTFEANATLVNLGGRQIAFVAASDVTDRKRYEDQLRRLNEELEERVGQRTAALAEAKERAEAADQAKSALLSRASHELRTPLNAILGFAQLLALDELSGDQRESVEHILDGGSHLLGLVDEILDLARVETGRLALSLESTDLASLVREACELLTPLSRERGVTLEWQYAGAEGPWALADRQRLKQVLLNLLANAIKYNRENGSVIIRAYERDGATLRLAVTDTGPGIAHDQLDRLFNPFERLGADATGVHGTGLGLALSRALMEAMGGTIGVVSQPGAGSTFWIDFAPGEPTVMARPVATAPGVIAAAPDKPRRVLYIEDNLENLRLVESLLKRWENVTLIPAMQGRVGIDLAADQPDLIVLDVHLPDLTGEEVLRQLKANPATRGIPVIVASADATPERVAGMLDAGALEYFTKPLDIRQFLAALGRILGSSGGAQPN